MHKLTKGFQHDQVTVTEGSIYKTTCTHNDVSLMEELSEKEQQARLAVWNSIISEADVFRRQNNYKQAQDLYTRAIQLQPSVAIYIARSHCRAMHGDPNGALQDANQVLELEPGNIKGILCKADALYTLGDFEMAMVWYSRGQKQRPDMVDFEQGVEKCKDSIRKAIQYFDTSTVKKFRDRLKEDVHFRLYHSQKRNSVVDQHLLEELYEDYAFLKDLRKTMTDTDDVSKAIEYLDTRIEFWRARNPKAVHDKQAV